MKFSQIAVQRFGNTMLTMLYSSALELDSFKVGPDVNDSNFNPVAGRLFALSALDASKVWEKSPVVRQFHFPISQDRNSPVAVFVRLLRLSKIANTAVDYMSIAIVDIRNGRVLYSRDDLPAIRGLSFSEEILADQNTIAIDYLGTRVELNWTNEPWQEEPVYDFGNLEYQEFKKRMESKLMGSKSTDLKPSLKPESSPNK